jgi:hypothetical protein
MLRIVQAIIAVFFLILVLKITVVAVKFLLFVAMAALIYNVIRKR